jgi:hypothetical protein
LRICVAVTMTDRRRSRTLYAKDMKLCLQCFGTRAVCRPSRDDTVPDDMLVRALVAQRVSQDIDSALELAVSELTQGRAPPHAGDLPFVSSHGVALLRHLRRLGLVVDVLRAACQARRDVAVATAFVGRVVSFCGQADLDALVAAGFVEAVLQAMRADCCVVYDAVVALYRCDVRGSCMAAATIFRSPVLEAVVGALSHTQGSLNAVLHMFVYFMSHAAARLRADEELAAGTRRLLSTVIPGTELTRTLLAVAAVILDDARPLGLGTVMLLRCAKHTEDAPDVGLCLGCSRVLPATSLLGCTRCHRATFCSEACRRVQGHRCT